MTTTSTDPRDIEAELERDRAQLASTLDELSDRVSVDSLAREALHTVQSYAGSYTSTVDHAIRANPLAVALIGAGVAWLAFGGRARSALSSSRDRDAGFMGHPVHDELPRWESEGGSPPEYGVAYRPTTSQGDDHSWWSSIRDLRGKATAALHRIEHDARSAYESVRDGVSGGAGSARDFAAERSQVVTRFTADLRERLGHGLDGLPEPARERIMAARERAYAASLKAEQIGRQVATDPVRAMEDHPLVAGAVAFALGAAVAAMLPRTDAEDRAFGSERDRLMDEAARLLRSERERAMGIAGTIADEVKAAASELAGEVRSAATDAAGSVADTARAKAQEAASRVGERATEEVNRLADGVASETKSDPVIG